MADLNLKAKEFVPSWLKPKAVSAAPTSAPPAKPAASPPEATTTPVPPSTSAAASGGATSTAAPQPPAGAPPKRTHMNPNAATFEPRTFAMPAPQQHSSYLHHMPPPFHPAATSSLAHAGPTASSVNRGAPPVHRTAPTQQGHAPPTVKAPQLQKQTQSPHHSYVPSNHVLPPATQPIVQSSASQSRHGSANGIVAADINSSLLKSRTDAEVIAISRKSTLKVGAAVFIPGQRTVKRAGDSARPSPLTLTPAVPDTEMLLFDAWCLYCLCNSVTREENYDPTLVFRIDSVATFWKTMNHLPNATELDPPATMYLFRDDINPKWEDPKNVSGGIWKIRVERQKIDAVWLVLACKTIGESWLKEHRNTINGIVLKVREKGFFVEVWVTERREQFPSDLLHALEHELPLFAIDYYTHGEIQEKLKEVAALATRAGKGGKKGGKRK